LKEIDKHLVNLQKDMNFTFKWCTDFQLQLKANNTVNVWPKRRKYYVLGDRISRKYKTITDCVRIACGKKIISNRKIRSQKKEEVKKSLKKIDIKDQLKIIKSMNLNKRG
jgi:hypothetical protein